MWDGQMEVRMYQGSRREEGKADNTKNKRKASKKKKQKEKVDM